MSEINSNINKIRFNSKIENINKSAESKKSVEGNEVKESTEQNIVPDTGVLGRSQIVSTKGMDCTQSIDEAVKLANECPEILKTGDDMFDSLYEEFLNSGMKPDEAYSMASMGMHEFMEIATPRIKK
ncbi:hypothetical protein IJ182_04040 [bacterium]|nr:hypothetical protein [bacterium]